MVSKGHTDELGDALHPFFIYTTDSYSRPTLIHARLLFTPGFDLRLVIICGQLLVTANSYLPLASITVFNAKLGARYLPQPALF